MILLKGKFCGSNKYTNCIRQSECIFCHACESYSARMSKCLKCYEGKAKCSCTPEIKTRVMVMQRMLRQASFSPNLSKKNPRGLVELAEERVRQERREQHGVPEYEAREI